MIPALLFPTKSNKQKMLYWTIGRYPNVLEAAGEWMRVTQEGAKPKWLTPNPFKPEQLQRLKVPMLILFGQKDNVVGDPQKAKKLARHIPDLQVEVVDSGHIMSTEQPDYINDRIHKFFEQG